MDNYNQMMNNDYNSMVYQNAGHQIPLEQQSEQPQHEMSGGGDSSSLLLQPEQETKLTSNEYNQQEEQQQTMAAGMPTEEPMEQEYGQQSQQQQQQDTHLQAQDALLIQNHQAQLQQSSVIEQSEEFNSGSGTVLEQGSENVEETGTNEEKPEADETDEKVTEAQETTEKDENDPETVPEQTEGENETDDKVKEEEEGESQEQVEGTSEPPKPKEPKIDPDQCRSCTSKENLQSIFGFKGTEVIANLYKMICPKLHITERDALPHMICTPCVDKIYMAYEFRQVAEKTDKDFRAQLKRSQNKRRPASDYILLDAKVALISSSEDEEDAMMQDDDDFKVSKSEESEESEDSVDSDFKPKKKYYKKKTPSKKKKKAPVPPKSTPGKRGRKAGRPAGSASKKYKSNVVYIEAVDDDDDSDVPISKKRKRATGVAAETSEGGLPCPQCDRVLGNSHGLREHLKSHSTEKYTCRLCNKQFKLRLSLDAHMARHKEEKERAEQKAKVKLVKIPTPIVKKAVPSKPSIMSSKSVASAGRKREGEPTTGKDLFKTCAPLTSTYWSDSFSD